jgi:hypothetical protein
MLKKGDDDDDEVEDEVRTTVPSQYFVTVTLTTEEFFLRNQYLQLSTHFSRAVGGGGQEIRVDSNCDT